MNNETLLQLFESIRSGNEEEIMAASNELLAFYSIPDSLPILSSLYLSASDDFTKKSIIIGISKALNGENLSNLTPEQLTTFQDNLIEILTRESDSNLLDNINPIFYTLLNNTKKSWGTLDNYIYTCENYNRDYFFVLNSLITWTKTEDDCGEIIEFTYPKLQQVFQNDSTSLTKLSAFCFILTVSIRFNQQQFLWEFTEAFKNFFQKLCIDADHKLLKEFIEILLFIEYGIETSEFSKQVCPLSDILEYSLSSDSNYSNCINLRVFINKSLIVSETDLNDLPQLLINLIELSKKLYSTEIDVQTQQIDDYFPILKYIPFEQRQEICISHIENLIQECSPASICTALALFRGSIISGIRFTPSCLDFFIQCYEIDHLDVKIFAASTLVDIAEELSAEIEEQMDTLLSMFCQNLISSIELPIEDREPFALSVLDVLQTVLIFCVNFSDEITENLIKSLTAFIQNGTQTEQFYALTDLNHIIRKSQKVALNQEIISLLLHLLQNRDSSLRSYLYEIFTLYVDYYPQNTFIGSIIESISKESDEDCFVYMTILSHIALKFPTNEQIKEFTISKVQLILNESGKEGDEIQNSENDHRGCAISALFLIMTAYTELVPSIFPLVVNSIAKIIASNIENDTNINYISKGIDIFMTIDSIEESYTNETFGPIFDQILIKSGPSERYINIDTNLFEFVYLMTDFVKISDIPNIEVLIWKSLKKFVILMQSDEKKDIKGIQTISNFVRKVFNNYESERTANFANQIVYLIIQQLLNKQSSPVLESHLILILESLVPKQIEAFSSHKSELMAFLIEKMTNSIPNTAKSIAYFFKGLAESNFLMDFIENDQENFKLLWNSLFGRLSKNCEAQTLLILNDNIISALILIEKNLEVLEIDEFYELILPFLPSYTDTDELFDIYSSLLEFFSKMNEKNQHSFITILIKFFSYPQSAEFIECLNNSESEDLMVFVFNLINGKIGAVDDSKSFINSIVSDDFYKSVFASNFNYIGSAVQQILSQKDEAVDNE